MPTREGRPFVGSEDYMDLFTPNAPWENADGHVDVFKLYGEWVAYHATTAQLRQVVQDVERRGMALAVEAGPLPTEPVCGGGVPPEGFAGIGEGLQIARRIEAVGGTVDYLAFDEPASFGHLYDGAHACHWELERIAEEAYRYVEAIRTVFPDVVVGDIEPLWNDAGLDVYKRWIETYAECGCSDPTDFSLYEVRYVEGESGANRVPNGGFGPGQSGWGFWEVSRRRIDLEPSLAASGTVTTGANGEFEFSLEEIPAGSAAVKVSSAGDESAWPATSRDVVSGP